MRTGWPLGGEQALGIVLWGPGWDGIRVLQSGVLWANPSFYGLGQERQSGVQWVPMLPWEGTSP